MDTKGKQAGKAMTTPTAEEVLARLDDLKTEMRDCFCLCSDRRAHVCGMSKRYIAVVEVLQSLLAMPKFRLAENANARVRLVAIGKDEFRSEMRAIITERLVKE